MQDEDLAARLLLLALFVMLSLYNAKEIGNIANMSLVDFV